jgi:hypothetical protein
MIGIFPKKEKEKMLTKWIIQYINVRNHTKKR